MKRLTNLLRMCRKNRPASKIAVELTPAGNLPFELSGVEKVHVREHAACKTIDVYTSVPYSALSVSPIYFNTPCRVKVYAGGDVSEYNGKLSVTKETVLTQNSKGIKNQTVIYTISA